MDAVVNNELLIAEIEKRPSLWLASHRQHKNKSLKAALWQEVAAEVLPGVPPEESVDFLQRRWKSLRDKFRRFFTAEKTSKKSGASAEEVEAAEVAWPYYAQLSFLRDTMESRPTSGNYRREPGEHSLADESCTSGLQAVFDLDGDASVQFDELPTSFEVVAQAGPFAPSFESPASTESPPSIETQVPVTDSQASAESQGSAVCTPGKRKRKGTVADDGMLVAQVGRLTEALNTSEHDEHELFALSLAKMMKSVPKEHQISLRIKLLQAFQEYMTV